MTEHILKPLPCVSSPTGVVVRPFDLNGEVIYNYPINATMENDGNARKEMIKLCMEIRNRTGIELIPEDIPKILKNGGKIIT